MPVQSDFAPYASLKQNEQLHGDINNSLYPFANAHEVQNNKAARDELDQLEAIELDAVVVGASWAGIWALYRLQSMGLRVNLLDACSDVGGVWWYTRYPGCRVDTEIPFYEFSKPELWKKWNWTERFPTRAEIHSYLSWRKRRFKDRNQERPLTTAAWTIQTNNGVKYKAQFILPCAGYSTIRHVPDLPGLREFEVGHHTSAWPEDLSCRGKRVAVIGTAASGIQVIEALAKEVDQLVVFQRTPNLATPMRNVQYTEDEMAAVKQDYPRRFASRDSKHGFDTRTSRLSSEHTPEEREAFFEELWRRCGLAFWFANYQDLLIDPIANVRAYNFWRNKVRQRIHDRDTSEMLAPMKPPHPFGTKRPSLETSYFEVFNQHNVQLIDVNSDPIVEVTRNGIWTASDRFFELDVIALATGFDFITGSMLAMGIQGRGVSLNDRWSIEDGSEGIFTHLGLMTRSFPNMFFPMGPQAPSALGLTPQMAEIQGDWIANLLVWMKKYGKKVVEPSVEAENAWTKEIQQVAKDSLFAGTNSWYMGVNIPGRKRQAMCYFGGVDKYMAALEDSARNEYADFVFG